MIENVVFESQKPEFFGEVNSWIEVGPQKYWNSPCTEMKLKNILSKNPQVYFQFISCESKLLKP